MAALDEQEIDRRLAGLPGWERKGGALRRDFKFEDFVASIDFVNRIVPAAEDRNHHPDLAISWNEVSVALTTHSEGGVTQSDFDLAAEIDSLA